MIEKRAILVYIQIGRSDQSELIPVGTIAGRDHRQAERSLARMLFGLGWYVWRSRWPSLLRGGGWSK